MAVEGEIAARTPGPARLHWIDWLRVFAVAGIVVYHTLRPFDLTDWHVKNAETSDLLGAAQLFLSTFGLAVLFLLAGAGVQFALRRRSPTAFLRERTARLLVPFVVGTLLLSPVQSFVETAHNATVSGPLPDWVGWWTRIAPEEIAGHGFSPAAFGVGYHLWFLGFLFAFSVVGLPIFLALKRPRGVSAIASLASHVAARPGSTFLFAVPLFLLLMAFAAIGTGEHGWADFGHAFGFFVIGFVLLADQRFLAAVRRDLPIAFAVGVVGTAALAVLDFGGWVVDDTQHEVNLRSLAIVSVFVVQGWAWTLVVLNLGMRASRLQRPVSPAINEAVLPVYVIHQPVILAVAFVVVQWPIGIVPKWIALFAVSAAATLLLVELALRNRYTRMLLGARPGSQSPPSGASTAPTVREPGHVGSR